MAKMVGLSRKVRLQWLNKAASMYTENLPEAEYKAQLNEYLSFEIDSPTVLRKTREILMHAWYYDDDQYAASIRSNASSVLAKYPEDAAAIHWCLLLLSYPVLVDLSRLIGRLSDFTDTMTMKQIKQKLYDEWGERATLFHSTDKILATMKELDVIRSPRIGCYEIVKHEVKHDAVISLLLRTAMKVEPSSYFSFIDLNQFNSLFPFEYSVDKETLMTDEYFTVTTFDGEISVALLSALLILCYFLKNQHFFKKKASKNKLKADDFRQPPWWSIGESNP